MIYLDVDGLKNAIATEFGPVDPTRAAAAESLWQEFADYSNQINQMMREAFAEDDHAKTELRQRRKRRKPAL